MASTTNVNTNHDLAFITGKHVIHQLLKGRGTLRGKTILVNIFDLIVKQIASPLNPAKTQTHTHFEEVSSILTPQLLLPRNDFNSLGVGHVTAGSDLDLLLCSTARALAFVGSGTAASPAVDLIGQVVDQLGSSLDGIAAHAHEGASDGGGVLTHGDDVCEVGWLLNVGC